MKQVTQTLRTGAIDVLDVPVPALHDGFVLVRNRASVISAGTEKSKVDLGRRSLLGKARARPDLVRQVLEKVRREGLRRTLGTVRARLDAPSPLGYSCAGDVLAVGGIVEGVRPGQRVACAGAGYANHAEVVAVPRNLVATIPDGVGYDEAAFTTIGAIALQGIRLLDAKLGENVLVIGLGLIGQIAVQLLHACGVRVLGSDLSPALCERARAAGAGIVAAGADGVGMCLAATGGRGVDGVLICAGTASNEPIEVAGAASRDKGRVVVVGAVGMDVPREPYFRKEVSLVISRSYGPGRYDVGYEEDGHDYPFGYVRFTQQRNMETVLAMLQSRRLDVASLVTHRFDVAQAADAYGLLSGQRREPYLGIVMTYAAAEAGGAAEPVVPRAAAAPVAAAPVALGGDVRVSLFGAGNYATSTLLPLLARERGVRLHRLCTESGRSAEAVARQFSFDGAAPALADLLDAGTDALLVVSRHDTHADAAVAALEAGRHVYVEKPLALDVAALSRVAAAARAARTTLMVGFNRRFSPLVDAVRAHLGTASASAAATAAGPAASTPAVIAIRVNAGAIPPEHWIQHPRRGGGRLIGEACHFVDLAACLAGSRIVRVHAAGTGRDGRPPLLDDNVVITLAFANRAVASIVYTADGARGLPKERVEVFAGGRAAVIDDFRTATLYAADGSQSRRKLPAQDKGQAAMLAAWLGGLRSGRPCVPLDVLLNSSLATVLAVESMMIGAPLDVDAALLAPAAAGVASDAEPPAAAMPAVDAGQA
jgi:polar amino acid transport system substrate-binding protein